MELGISAGEPHKADFANIEKKVLDIVIRYLGDDESSCESIKNNLSEVDSITFIKIVVSLENEFDIEFDDDMLSVAKFLTIKSIAEYIESKIK
ncbi:MAG: acyl carrier protein [Caulobacteraceae bacterium]